MMQLHTRNHDCVAHQQMYRQPSSELRPESPTTNCQRRVIISGLPCSGCFPTFSGLLSRAMSLTGCGQVRSTTIASRRQPARTSRRHCLLGTCSLPLARASKVETMAGKKRCLNGGSGSDSAKTSVESIIPNPRFN